MQTAMPMTKRVVSQRTWGPKGQGTQGLEQAWFFNLVFFEGVYFSTLVLLCPRLLANELHVDLILSYHAKLLTSHR
jgi:hypothetical protein